MASLYTEIFGPLLLGALFNYLLFGCLIVQLYDYFMTYREKDRWFIKALVCVIVVAEIIQLVLMTHTIYTTIVLGFNTIEYLLHTPWSSSAAPAINGIISMLIQIFFAWRIWILKNDTVGNIITCLIVAISVLQCSSSIAVTVKYIQIGRAPTRFVELTMVGTLWLSGSLVCDTMISVVMVYLLKQSKKKASFKASEAMVNTLIINTIETGAITTIFALIELVFFLNNPENFFHICFLYILGRLFSNVLLAVLNGRDRVRRAGKMDGYIAHGSDSQDLDLSFRSFYRSQNSQQNGATLPLHDINRCMDRVGQTQADYVSGRNNFLDRSTKDLPL
ncbi:hypothetical protein BDQ12DRAFT_725883 [Crucibulum laeve]|uniref:DUF6534 domain-containing protein n=1 Tax=Crucibulum laeve TaxID=68775 RepID=A0A5C3M3D4_9AGAR|nr:hypothetical protein BDQ12DRAFT_725883 [Crucibulum laeve]